MQLRGLPGAILRPGNMSGSTKSGVWNANDFYALFLLAVIDLGCAPAAEEMDRLGWEMDLTPVNWAAKCIAKSVMEPGKSLGKVMHVQNGQGAIPMSKVVSMLSEIGWSVTKRCSVASWSKLCEEKGRAGNDGLLKCSIAFDSFAAYFATGSATGGAFDCTNMADVMGGKKECVCEIDKEYLKKCLGWCGVALPE